MMNQLLLERLIFTVQGFLLPGASDPGVGLTRRIAPIYPSLSPPFFLVMDFSIHTRHAVSLKSRIKHTSVFKGYSGLLKARPTPLLTGFPI